MTEHLPSVFQAIVVRNDDPEKRARVILKIPAALGDTFSNWAEPTQPTPYIPKINELVWVVFVNGDINKPVYISSDVVSAEKAEFGWITAEHLAFTPATNADVTALEGEIEKKATFFFGGLTDFGGAQPVADKVGDLWIDTDNNRILKRWNGTAWVVADDQRVATALTNAATAQTTADSKINTYIGATAPWPDGDTTHDLDVGDLWLREMTRGTGDVTQTYRELMRWEVPARAWTKYDLQAEIIAPGAVGATEIDGDSVATQRLVSDMVATAGLLIESFAEPEDGGTPVRDSGRITITPKEAIGSVVTQPGLHFYPMLSDGSLSAEASFRVPMDGVQPLKFEGTVIAKEISVLDGATMRSLKNELSRGSRLTMAEGTTAPSQSPEAYAFHRSVFTGAVHDPTGSDIEYYGLCRGHNGNLVTNYQETSGVNWSNYLRFHDYDTGAFIKYASMGDEVENYGGVAYGVNPNVSTTPVTSTLTVTAGSTSITSAGASGFAVGAAISGLSGVPAGTIIQSVQSPGQATMSRAATASQTVSGTITPTNKRYYTLGLDFGGTDAGWKIGIYAPPDLDATTGNTVTMPLIKRYSTTDIPTSATYTIYDPAIGWDWVDSKLLYGFGNVNGTGKIRIKRITFDASDNVTTNASAWTSGDNYNQHLSFVCRANYDYGSPRWMLRSDAAASTHIWRVYPDANNSVHTSAERWGVAGGTNTTVRGAWYDGAETGLGQTVYHLASDGSVYRYERDGNMWTSDTVLTQAWSAAVTYRDENTAVTSNHPTTPPHDTCGGMHETTIGTRADFTMSRRAAINIIAPDMMNYNATNDSTYEWQDDPDAYGFYLAKSGTGTLYLQATPGKYTTNPPPPPGNIPTTPWKGLYVYNALTGTAQPPATNTFPISTPAEVVTTSGGFKVDARSNGSIGTGTFRNSAVSAGFVTCTSTTRPFGSDVYVGLEIYETDTTCMYKWDGSVWRFVSIDAPPRVRRYRVNDQTVPTSTWQSLSVGTNIITRGFTRATRADGGDQYTLDSVAGTYMLAARATWATLSGYRRHMEAVVNGVAVDRDGVPGSGATDCTVTSVWQQVQLVPGDVVWFQVWQNTGANTTLNASTAESRIWASILFVGP